MPKAKPKTFVPNVTLKATHRRFADRYYCVDLKEKPTLLLRDWLFDRLRLGYDFELVKPPVDPVG